MDLNQLKLECPTSGVLLGILVKSFELNAHGVGGDAADYLGHDDNASRNTRRYFAGDPFPEESRREVCRYAARAALHAGLLEGLTVPRDPSDPLAFLPSADEFLADAMFEFLRIWDATFHRAAEGWPHPPRALGGFVVGRQAVIDLAIRAAALLHLCGISDPAAVVLAAPATDAGGQLLAYLQGATGHRFSHHKLAKELRVERTTVDDWFAGRTIPSPDNLRALSKAFDAPGWPVPRLLRWLRVQFGFIAIARHLRAAIGDDFAGELLYTFAQLTGWTLGFHAQSRAPRPTFLFSQRRAFRAGIEAPGSNSVLNALYKTMATADDALGGRLWIDDLLASRDGCPGRRIEACFTFVGDWPRDTAKFDADPEASQLPEEERRVRQLALALLCISPSSTAAALSSGPPGDTPADNAWAGVHAWQLVYTSRHAEAVPIFRGLLAADPGNAETHCYLGSALAGTGVPADVDDARAHFREACRLRPDWDFPVGELARTYLAIGRFDLALACVDAAPPDLVAGSNDCTFVRALALANLGRPFEALAAARRAADLDLKHAEAWSLAADQAFLIGDRQSGARYVKLAAHLGHATVRRSGMAYPNAICPSRTADGRRAGGDTHHT